ncbi:Hypothetical predicted protein [Cloeon dipterum]|uniref:PSI domain-containing protein n=1 Tax=Cloeon dipterum TaxID=197152 RepID=A0A8S1DLR4_9INSE|nr:Hypothetical predicted protein [Cloeon dipterum]
MEATRLFLIFAGLISRTTAWINDEPETTDTEMVLWSTNSEIRARFIESNINMAKQLWVDLQNDTNVVSMRSQNLTRDEMIPVDLTFNFKFFNHDFRRVGLLASGVISSYSSHDNKEEPDWRIVPLLHEYAVGTVTYLDTGNSLIVQWLNYALVHMPEMLFFQATIFENGTIEFVYREVPTRFGLKMNSKDSYEGLIGVIHFYTKLKFHNGLAHYCSLNFNLDKGIHVGSIITIEPMPLCTFHMDCSSCINSSVLTKTNASFQCHWCPELMACSSKNDFLSDVWKHSKCVPDEVVRHPDQCGADLKPIIEDKAGGFSSSFGLSYIYSFSFILVISTTVLLCIIHRYFNRYNLGIVGLLRSFYHRYMLRTCDDALQENVLHDLGDVLLIQKSDMEEEESEI